MSDRILFVDDESTLVETISFQLKNQGYEVITAMDGEAALAQARSYKPDLIILDIMLPKLDGFEVCRILRKEMNSPILMLTARDDEIDRVVGLEVGADDYLTKPFSMRELFARVKALLRRVRLIKDEIATSKIPSTEKSLHGDIAIDLDKREVYLDDHPVALKPKEYELLLYLAEHAGRVIPRDTLLEKVWGWEYTGGSRTVDVHIRWLREKLEKDPSHPRHFMTIRSIGYRFES